MEVARECGCPFIDGWCCGGCLGVPSLLAFLASRHGVAEVCMKQRDTRHAGKCHACAACLLYPTCVAFSKPTSS